MSPKILFTASNYSHIRNFHLPYLEAFRSLGWTIHVGCGGITNTFPEADCFFELPFEKKLSAASNFCAMQILHQAMKKNRYDLICTHTSLAAFFTRLGVEGVTPRPPVVDVVHGYLFKEKQAGFQDNILLLAEKLLANRTNLLLTMNRVDYHSATEHRLGRRIVEIPGMGVDFTKQDKVTLAEAESLRKTLQRKENDILLLCAAEFSPRKNQAMLLRALPQLPARIRLILPGEGALLERCRAIAEELGIADRTVFPGHVTNIPVWYAAVDAYVSASRSEGLPFSIIEAMYAGLPVVASQIKGHTDLIEDGYSGLLYSCDDIAGFIRQIRRLTDDAELVAQIGAAAKNAVSAYALERVLPKVMELYLSVAGKHMQDTANTHHRASTVREQ